jgi:hypothetical protein
MVHSSQNRISWWRPCRTVAIAIHTHTWTITAIPFCGAHEDAPLITYYPIFTRPFDGFVFALSLNLTCVNKKELWLDKKWKVHVHAWTNSLSLLPKDTKSVNMKMGATIVVILEAMEIPWVWINLDTYLYWKVPPTSLLKVLIYCRFGYPRQ